MYGAPRGIVVIDVAAVYVYCSRGRSPSAVEGNAKRRVGGNGQDMVSL